MTDQHELTRPPSPEESPERRDPPKSSLSIAQVVGGALAAMTAAALGSRLSVAGTVVGAALASVVAAVGGALYTASLRRTSQHVGAVLTRVRPTTSSPTPPASTSPATGLPAPRAVPARRSRIGWKAVVGAAVLMFVVAALALTGIELATGRALSGGSGTTVGQVAEPSTRPAAKPSERATTRPSASPTASATAVADPSASSSATASSRPSAEPSTSASAEPSTTPTAGSTGSSAPSTTPAPTPAAVPSGATPAP